MAPHVKKVMSSVSDSLENACGVLLCLGVAYALLFVDLTGNGRLWDAVRGAVAEQLPAQPDYVSKRDYHVPARDMDSQKRAQDRMLMIDYGDNGLLVPVVASRLTAPPPPIPQSAPAASATKDWRVHLQGSLPEVAVSGPASQGRATSAIGTASAVRAVASSGAAPISAYRAGSTATGEPEIVAAPRPGIISDRAASLPSASAGDGVQNFR
jgi:hypothetical protein